MREQGFQQATQNHCIGNVRNMEFIETNQAAFGGDLFGNFVQRIAVTLEKI